MADIVHPEDKWSAGDAYEPFVGRWSRLVAAEFVDWLAIPEDARWLDVGCGTGALTEAIVRGAAPREVVGVDPSEAFLGFARSRLGNARVSLRTGDARERLRAELPTAPDGSIHLMARAFAVRGIRP